MTTSVSDPTCVLTEEQQEQFLTRGHIMLRGCFTPEQARPWVDRAWERLGYDRNDPATWAKPRIHMRHETGFPVRTFAPKAYEAMCALLGGPERIAGGEPHWGDAMIVNLAEGADRPWQPPSPASPGWHKDGDFFRHFLDSPEQGLLPIPLWTDVWHTGGGTFVACDSVPVVAKFLAERPEGVKPNDFPFQDLVAQCHDFIEVTGEAGDVALLHPFALHAVSQNVLRRPRMITNPPVHLAEPMRFDRPDGDYSLVERAILRGLGVERLDFTPAAPRERWTVHRG